MGSDQIQALKEEIWRRARQKADQILRDAEKEAERIIKEARGVAEKSIKSKIEPEKLLMKRRILGEAVNEGRKMVISAKNELMEKAFQIALERLKREAESKSEAYRIFLLKSLKDGLDKLSGSDGSSIVVYANESDISLLKNMVKELSSSQIDIRFEKAEIMGGVILSEANGKKVFYNSIESRLEALKPILREHAASILFREVGEN